LEERRTSPRGEQRGASDEKFGVSAPSITLPKGGGAISGIGEKFGANPVTGTGSMTVPVFTSPGRSGFGPQLSLSYDSGAGNGAFGFGWNLSLPAITRKTDKGLPQYGDAEESDVFILSGAEDLVPLLVENGGQRQRHEFVRTVDGVSYRVQRYRPRIEGLFARIERWTDEADPEVSFWRSISKDNITTFYGKTAESRIADPVDPTRIFSWLICQSYDDKGNAIIYTYAEENSDGVDLSQAHEKNRTPSIRAANRHLKRVHYGNRQPNRDAEWNATDPALLPDSTWMFEVVFDYGDHDSENPLPEEAGKQWPVRNDPFSSYRPGFEVRTYRLCQRVLMFHHFPREEGVGRDCLVRSTDFTYSYEENPADTRNPIFSFLLSVIQCGYKRPNGGYLKKSLPPLEFEYTEPTIDATLREIDPESLENLPYGLDGGRYRWVDLDGEGLSGILTEQAAGWFYKRNLSPINTRQENGREIVAARFAPVERVRQKPSLAAISSGRQQLLDLAGDGQVDLVELEGPTPGFYERTEDEHWETFVPFTSMPNLGWDNPNLKFVDLTGDGHADILISEDEVFCWHPSLAEAGFGPPERVHKVLDEEKGPKLVLADGTESIYLADMSGDGLTDLVRIRNGEVCYWPNLGYGCFGAKVTMDNAPSFDRPDIFDERRIRLADIDGSGVTDVLYLSHRGVQVYFNQSGNSWSAPTHLMGVPPTDNVKSVTVVDLLGNGTACLVWSSPLSSDVRQPMRYLDLMGGQKPHLLVKEVNNLGAETHVHYAPSTKFYLADKVAGTPWITRLPFPVHVVERVDTLDRISGNRFVTRYAYHHGYFDGPEREFRGFGMVEQLDTEEFSALAASGTLPDATNIDEASHVPPVLTRTWFHTGAFLDESRISKHFEHEYYREGDASESLTGLTDEQLRALLLDDTLLPSTLRLADGTRTPYTPSTEEILEACRALKGAVLRQEIYALDGTDEADRPYSTSERNYTIEVLQPRDGNKHAVFFSHARDQVDFYYERALVDVNGQKRADPRVSHSMMLEVDAFGNALRSVAIGYRRRDLPGVDAAEQKQTHLTFTANRFANRPDELDWYRIGLPVEARTYEIVKPPEPTITDTRIDLFPFEQIETLTAGLFPLDRFEPSAAKLWPYEKWDWHRNAAKAPPDTRLRLIEHVRTLYRRDNLTGPLALGEVDSLALPFESYKLAFTAELAQQLFVASGKLTAAELNDVLADEGKYVHSEGDANWWIPSGHIFYSVGANDTAAHELEHARTHFFLPHRYRDPFHTNQLNTETVVTFDDHKLLVVETRDAIGNVVHAQNDYRVLAPRLMIDPNGNRSEVAFDGLGMVVATAVKGKLGEKLGDLLEDFDPDPPLAALQAFFADPNGQASSLLGKATTRIVYELDCYQRSGQPPFAATLARETHFFDPGGPHTKIQVSFSYSDGFGREIQKKIQAEHGDAPQRGPDVTLPSGDVQPGALKRDVNGDPVQADTPQRWVGSGRTVFNNKGNPVRQYEPFFSSTHLYEEEREMTDTGVSPVLFYDPVQRGVATLHPNHTWEKVVFDPWQQTTFDVNDTVTFDPNTDPDAGAFFSRLPDGDYLPTWHQQRINGGKGPEEKAAAEKAAKHADTPTIAHFDSLGRPFLSVADNGEDENGNDRKFRTCTVLDIEGNQPEVIDALDRVVMRYDYDMLGTRIHQASMEAGERFMLNDVTGKPIHDWDSLGRTFRTEYDELRRPLRAFVTGADVQDPGREILFDQIIYGDSAATGLSPGQILQANLRGKPYKHYDTAGIATSEAYDFKGNLLRATRQLVQDYTTTPYWSQNPLPALEVEVFASTTSYDALNRPIQLIAPHSGRPGATINVIRPGYNEANLLERMEAWLDQSAEPTELLNPQSANLHAVANIDYDAKGQRTRIEYGNGALTEYTYDDQTFRLIHLKTSRTTSGPHISVVQDLFYTYDPVGNITLIRDDAQQTIFFNGQVVPPLCDYAYDAIYRLTNATGREHIGQAGKPETTAYDESRIRLAHPNDGQKMRNYTETYFYDPVGNFESLVHQAANGNWTRSYVYDEPSLIEPPSENSNRLSRTIVGNNNPVTEAYSHDAHGNMTGMPHLTLMQWDLKDQLSATSRQVVNPNPPPAKVPETTFYVYDGGGQRMRKTTERQNGTRKEERIYLGGFEIFRKFDAGSNAVAFERETLHVMDDKQRIALVETRTEGNDASPRQLIRYQFGNHLGSASLELDDQSQIISYEEYFPYGSTSYQAVRSQTETPKRYRYTGMERDEESGLNYHGARYYAPWLGRWVSCDPIGIKSDLNLYVYTHNNCIRFNDPGGKDPPPDAVSQISIHGNVITATQTLHREDTYSNLDSRLETSVNVVTGDLTQRLYRRSIRSSEWTDVTEQALRSDYLNPEGTKKGELSVEWNMPGRRSNVSGGSAASALVAEQLISEIPPSLVIPSVKDSILTEHFESTPEGEHPYQHYSDMIGRRWSATGARKTAFYFNKVVSVASAGVAVGSAVNSTAKGVSAITAAMKAEALASKNAARLVSRFDLGKSLATKAEMVQGVRELEAGLKPSVPGSALSATHTLTDFQRRALAENVRLVIGKTVAAVKAGATKQSLVNQLANPRFRFLGQIPEARAALIDALKGTGVKLPAGL
jgi:RHS repeat-associated protein